MELRTGWLVWGEYFRESQRRREDMLGWVIWICWIGGVVVWGWGGVVVPRVRLEMKPVVRRRCEMERVRFV